jgi:hypothetical protein
MNSTSGRAMIVGVILASTNDASGKSVILGQAAEGMMAWAMTSRGDGSSMGWYVGEEMQERMTGRSSNNSVH